VIALDDHTRIHQNIEVALGSLGVNLEIGVGASAVGFVLLSGQCVELEGSKQVLMKTYLDKCDSYPLAVGQYVVRHRRYKFAEPVEPHVKLHVIGSCDPGEYSADSSMLLGRNCYPDIVIKIERVEPSSDHTLMTSKMSRSSKSDAVCNMIRIYSTTIWKNLTGSLGKI
jgi:hypothetical protein